MLVGTDQDRQQWGDLLREGVVPYLLGVAGVYALVGLMATPLVTRPMDFINSIFEVNFLDDGVERITQVVKTAQCGV